MTPKTSNTTYNYFNTTVGNCYHVSVEVPTPSGKILYFFALVDTGADDLVLPAAYLPDFYPAGSSTPTTPIGTAAGLASLPIYHGHNFLVDGVPVKSDIVFAPLAHTSALCGRVPLMGCSKKFGLRTTELLRE